MAYLVAVVIGIVCALAVTGGWLGWLRERRDAASMDAEMVAHLHRQKERQE